MGTMRARDEFDRCWPWLEKSCSLYGHPVHGPTHGKEDVWRLCAAGKAHFIPGERSALVGEFWTSPTGIKTLHGWLGGGDLYEIKRKWEYVEGMARDSECHRIVITGREQWLRALDGFRILSTRLVKDL